MLAFKIADHVLSHCKAVGFGDISRLPRTLGGEHYHDFFMVLTCKSNQRNSRTVNAIVVAVPEASKGSSVETPSAARISSRVFSL
jgi:hypothetical protein